MSDPEDIALSGDEADFLTSDDEGLGELDGDSDDDEPVPVDIDWDKEGPFTPSIYGPRSFGDLFETVKQVDPERLVEETKSNIKYISEVLGVTIGIAGALLKTCGWDKALVMDQFVKDQAGLCERAHVQLSHFSFKTGGGAGSEGGETAEVECPVCWDDKPSREMYALPCDHFLCKTCWKKYLQVSIAMGPGCVHTVCPHRGPAGRCKDVVTEELFREIGIDEDFLAKYDQYLLRSFVADNPHVKWCPAPDCGQAIYCPDQSVENVRCKCGELFCFKCQREAHEPCGCESVTSWIVKEQSSEETSHWMQVNTHICPNKQCNIVIAKDQGCNHMTCPQCKYEFCWVCLGEWAPHGSSWYNCSRFDPSKKKAHDEAVTTAKAALEKYQHYFTRYAVHLNSQRFEKKLRDEMEAKKEEYMQHQKVLLAQAEFLDRGVNQLCECRRALKYTHVHAFYLDDGREKELFEFLQNDLEKETERLSGLMEAKVQMLHPEEIEACTVSAQERLRLLLDGCREGLSG